MNEWQEIIVEERITISDSPWLFEPIETFKGMNHPAVVEWFRDKIAELGREFDKEYVTHWIDEKTPVPNIYYRGQYTVDKETKTDSEWDKDLYGVILKV